jgi:hypothetical protein
MAEDFRNSSPCRYTMYDIKDNAIIKEGFPGINEYYEQKLQALQNRRHKRNGVS